MEAWRNAFQAQFQQQLAEWDEESAIHERLMSEWRTLFNGEPEERVRPFIPRMVKDREWESGHHRIWKDYFAERCTYSAKDFKRRFRMSRRMVLRLVQELPAHDDFFVQSYDAANRLGLSPLQKITSAIRQLAYGYGSDATDEYCRLGDTTGRKCLYRFCKAVRELYGPRYLRKPNAAEVKILMEQNSERGFPGMVGSLDCMHYRWSNCPTAWQGAFGNRDGDKTIVLEAVADFNLYFWHAFFGIPGANNDINVLQRSPLISDLITNGYNDHEFTLNGDIWKGPYVLVDGIYPRYRCFVATIPEPQTEANKLFAKLQEGCRKDIERAFGVLQIRWGIVSAPARPHTVEKIMHVLFACIILHNMCIEDQLGEDEDEIMGAGRQFVIQNHRTKLRWNETLDAINAIESSGGHHQLKDALVRHIWNRHGSAAAF